MRIGIDCRTILNPERGEAGGIGHYTYQLVRYLLKNDRKNHYVLFFDRSVKEKKIQKFRKKNTTIRYFPFSQYKKFLPLVCSHFLVTAFISREKLDVFHSPSSSLPRFYKGLSIVTLHDLTIFKKPEYFPESQYKAAKEAVPRYLKQVKKVITPSESTKRDLIKLFKANKDKIEVIPHGVDERFFKKESPKKINKIRKKLGISQDYILYLSILSPRKNILRIVRAFEKLKKEKRGQQNVFKNYQLVLAGKQLLKFKNTLKKIEESEFKKDIILPGYIDPEDIGPLYKGAKVFLFPSLYEGFGLPILEAMAEGIPVITSNVSSMPEVADEAALLVNPNKVLEIYQGLVKLITNKKLAKKLSIKGIKRAKKFSWDKTAKKTLLVYYQASE